MEEIDLNLIVNKVSVRTFIATNPDGTPQSLVDHTVQMIVYKDPEVPVAGVLGGTSNNEITFSFGASVNQDEGLWEYEIIATPGVGDPVFLGRGNISFGLSAGFTSQISTLVDREAFGMTITEDLKTQLILYWKHFLQEAFNIDDADLYVDSAWPILARFFIAKLVVHDYITQLMKGALASSFGVSEVTGGGGSGALKSLETGPSKAEWYDTNDALTKLTAKAGNGTSAFDQLSVGICTLASKLGVYLPMCGIVSTTVLPIFVSKRRYYNRAVTIGHLILCDYGPDRG